MTYILTADIGGTKLASALFNSEKKMVQKLELPSEKNDEEQLFQQLMDDFLQLCEQQGVKFSDITGVAVGLPGLLNVEMGVVLFQNNLPLRHFPLVERLQQQFPQASVFMEKDVDMAAIGEYAARHFQKESLIYTTLSTGIACSTIVENRIIRGAGMAGEIGFTLTRKDQSLEQIIAGPGLEQQARLAFEDMRYLKDYLDDYYNGNQTMQTIVDEAMKLLATTLYHLILTLDPHKIVVGGGIFNHHPLLVEKVKEHLATLLIHPLLKGKEERIEGSLLKGDAALIGAASRVTM